MLVSFLSDQRYFGPSEIEFKQSLVEEYQTVSPINDEDELALEFTDENVEEDISTDEIKEKNFESESVEELEDTKKSTTETNDNEVSNTISENQDDQSS